MTKSCSIITRRRPHLRALLFLLFNIMSVGECSPPEDPIKCASSGNRDCTVTNAYGVFPDRSTCKAASAAFPATEEELVAVVAEATRVGRKMRVATRYSHSVPKLVCVDGTEGLVISTKRLNRTLGIDVEAGTMRVESGVTLQRLMEEAAAAGLALPQSPYWWGLTVGGMLGTGAHGSTLMGTGTGVHDYVSEIRIVTPAGADEGYAKVRRLDKSDQDFRAAEVSLGVLGVISQVTFKLERMFKRSVAYKEDEDDNLGEKVESFGHENEFGDISWYPSQGKVIYRIDNRVPSNTSGNGLYEATGFRSTLSLALLALRTTEEFQELTKDVDGKCLTAKLIIGTLKLTAFGLTNNGILFTGYPVIGYQNRIQASGTCLDSQENAVITACAWDPRARGQFYHQTTFSVKMSLVNSFIQDVQRLVLLEPKSLCGAESYNGILLRYVKASSAFLGKEEDAVDFDITYYRSKDPLAPRLYEDILEEIEQMGIFKYGALPHWGKNRNLAFDGVMGKYKNGGEFLKVKERYDPRGLFSSEWTDRVLGLDGGGVMVVKEGCALEGLCICSEDVHCAPSKGYYCRPGRVYKEARVCAPLATSNHNHRDEL